MIPRSLFSAILVLPLAVVSLHCCRTGIRPATVAAAWRPGTYELKIASVNADPRFRHEFTIVLDCRRAAYGAGRFTGEGSADYTTEAIQGIAVEDAGLRFQAKYQWTDYVWYPAFRTNADGTLTFQDGHGSDNVSDATGTWSLVRAASCR
jgi:hypothetical protein